MNEIPLGGFNELAKGIPCEKCNEISYYADELVFFLGNETVSVSEKYPDWDTAICTVCAEKHNLI